MFCKTSAHFKHTFFYCIFSQYLQCSDAIFFGTTDKVLLVQVHVSTLVYKTQTSAEMDHTSDKQNDDNSITDNSLDTSHLLLIVILSSASSLVISVVVIVIVVCRRSGQSKKREESIRKRKSAASQGRSFHVLS